jgi:hypothetical protein
MDNKDTMEKAKELGYKGDSNTEAFAWIGAVEKGLDMSEEARYARAREMGFNTEDIYYHGTKRQFDRFDKSTIGDNFSYAENSGFFFTRKKRTAESYSMNHRTLEVGRVITAFLKFENPYLASTDSDYWEPSDRFDISGHDMMHDVRLTKKDSILIKGTRNDDICIVLDPSQILSVHAAFDLETENYKPELDMEEILDDFVLDYKYDEGEGIDKLNDIISEFCAYSKQQGWDREYTEKNLLNQMPDWLGDSTESLKKCLIEAIDNNYEEKKTIKKKRRNTLRR